MAPFEMDQVRRHPLAQSASDCYGHFLPTPQRYPAYSAGIVPFRWLLREQLDELRNQLQIDVGSEREPELGYESNWVHEAQNQRNLLDAFGVAVGDLRKWTPPSPSIARRYTARETLSIEDANVTLAQWKHGSREPGE